MKPIYFPILKAKDAEFDALKNASESINKSIIPLFELPRFNPSLKKYQDDTQPKTTFLSELSEKIGSLRSGMFAMFDSYHWQNPGDKVETGEHHLSYFFNALNSAGVKAVPVVGYDRWDDQEYRIALRLVSSMHIGKFCIRLDRFAFDDVSDPEHFHERLSEIIDYLGLNPSDCHVVLDLEDISILPLVESLEKFDTLFAEISGYGFSSYSVAGCSLPSSIDKVVKERDSCGSVMRGELLVWKGARKQYPAHNIYFGDYGVRGPSTSETGFGNTNAKIRYTVDDSFYIVRGHVIRKPIGGRQHCVLAEKLIKSGYYLGPNFSWGDGQIQRCANGELGGAPATWIKIDTSHHLAHVVAEVAEFERAISARPVSSAK